MLEHLTQMEPIGEYIELDDASADELLSAQVATSDWLEELGAKSDEVIHKEAQVNAARKAFGALTTSATDEDTKQKLIQLKTPEAVRHVVGMLTAYDWEFVQQAKELRGYTVAKLVEESQNPNPNVRLKALGLLGKVTEVGLFTEKIEVKKTDLTEEEIDRKLREKLDRFMGVEDVVATDVEGKDAEPDHPDA
jgi:hypothetical protein